MKRQTNRQIILDKKTDKQTDNTRQIKKTDYITDQI